MKLCAKAGFTATEDLSEVKLTEKDALIVVDMQNDFVPLDSPVGGRFGVAGGGFVAGTICTMIQKFSESGGVVVATRDYHPHDHASFAVVSKKTGVTSGRFPAHCIQGNPGSELYPPIKDALQKARRIVKDKVKIAFKGFHEDIDSFGAFEYSADYAQKGGFPQSHNPDEQAGHRVSRRDDADSKVQQCMGCTLEPWTGSFVFKQSNLEYDNDLDAPPDVLSVVHSKRTLKQALLEEGIERVFVCGLALDFCVFDTALNAKDAGFKNVVFLLDASRPAFVPGYLPFYAGYAHEPNWTYSKLKEAGVAIWSAGAYAAVKEDLEVKKPRLQRQVSQQKIWEEQALVETNANSGGGGSSFPAVLPPLVLLSETKSLDGELLIDTKVHTCTIDLANHPSLSVLAAMGFDGVAAISPPSPVTLSTAGRAAAGISDAAVTFVWVHPLHKTHLLAALSRGYFAQNQSSFSFLFHGGFVYLDAAGAVVQICAVELSHKGETHNLLRFNEPQELTLAADGTNPLVRLLMDANRLQPVTMQALIDAGCTHFAWLLPSEQFACGLTGPANGSFLYAFPDSAGSGLASGTARIFAVQDQRVGEGE
jgi:nicotinamidase-related amidase